MSQTDDEHPRHHPRKMQKALSEMQERLRKDIEKVDEPQLKAMFETAAEEGFEDPPEHLFDPPRNLAAGARHLRNLLDWAGGDHAQALGAYSAVVKGADLKAVEAYNAGRGNYDSLMAQRYAAGVQRWKGMLT